MLSLRAVAILPMLCIVSACGGAQKEAAPPADAMAPARQFSFQPQVGKQFRHTMRRVSDVQIVGAPMRSTEEWQATWLTTVGKETNLFLYDMKLERLKLSINGAELLEGDEVADAGGFMELLFDSEAHIVDVRRTETITKAVVNAVPVQARQALGQMFAPQVLRQLYVERANERTVDLVAQPAEVGTSWKGSVQSPDGGDTVAKELRVVAAQPCGSESCVRVERQLVIPHDAVWRGAHARVKAYLAEQGQDPNALTLVDASVLLEDEFIVNPDTMQFHGARFEQLATLEIEGEQGRFTVKFSTVRESTYEF